MTTYSKQFLHHGVPCEVAAELSNNEARALGFINGASVESEPNIPLEELEGALLILEKRIRNVISFGRLKGPEFSFTEKMLLQLGFIKRDTVR